MLAESGRALWWKPHCCNCLRAFNTAEQVEAPLTVRVAIQAMKDHWVSVSAEQAVAQINHHWYRTGTCHDRRSVAVCA